MDMYSRNQYLKQIRSKYLKTKFKKKKGELMNEAEKHTGLNQKSLYEKLKLKSNLDKIKTADNKLLVIFVSVTEPHFMRWISSSL